MEAEGHDLSDELGKFSMMYTMTPQQYLVVKLV